MLTPNGFKNTLASLLMGVELTEELENVVSVLQNDFDERNVIIEKYGNEYDSELESYDFVEKTNENIEDGYKEKYLALKEKYINRFMGKELENNDENVTDENENDENVTIEDLFENKEEN